MDMKREWIERIYIALALEQWLFDFRLNSWEFVQKDRHFEGAGHNIYFLYLGGSLGSNLDVVWLQ